MKKNYNVWKLSGKEFIFNFLLWASLCILPAYFFYHSFGAYIILILFFPVFLHFQKKRYIEKRRRKLIQGFQEMVRCLYVHLQSGSNTENALRKTIRDMNEQLKEYKDINEELRWIAEGMNHNEKTERLFMDFGERSQIPEIMEFAELFSLGKQMGGNLNEMIARTDYELGQKLELENELQTMIASQEFEMKIMSLAPFGIMAYISFTSPGYFQFFYEGFSGRIIMTICLLLYLFALFWGMKMIQKGSRYS